MCCTFLGTVIETLRVPIGLLYSHDILVNCYRVEFTSECNPVLPRAGLKAEARLPPLPRKVCNQLNAKSDCPLGNTDQVGGESRVDV